MLRLVLADRGWQPSEGQEARIGGGITTRQLSEWRQLAPTSGSIELVLG